MINYIPLKWVDIGDVHKQYHVQIWVLIVHLNKFNCIFFNTVGRSYLFLHCLWTPQYSKSLEGCDKWLLDPDMSDCSRVSYCVADSL